MKIKKLTVENFGHTYDIEVPVSHHYSVKGVATHNSSVISNSTNGIEPIRSFFVTKKGVVVVAPEYSKLKNKYDLLWDMESPKGYLRIMGIIQKFIDQSISTNTSYNSSKHYDGKMPLNVLIENIVYCYAIGLKTLYYCNDAPEDEKNVEKIYEEKIESCDSCTI